MKYQLLFSAIAAVAAGAFGGIVVSSNDSPTAHDDAAVADEVAALHSAVSSLQTENARLRDRLQAIEDRPVVAEPSRVAVTDKPDEGELAPELQDLVASLRNPEAQLPENLRDEIAAVYTDIRAKEEKERQEERDKREQEQFEERLTRMAKDMNLNTYQTNEMRKTLTAAEEKREKMRDAMRDNGGDFDNMRNTWDALRAETKADMSRYLTNEQIATYEESYGRRGGFGRDGGRRNQGGTPGGGTAPGTAPGTGTGGG